LRSARIVQENRQAKRFVVSGMVQGVGYRFFAQRAAERLGVAGYVKNLRDGCVEVYAIGTTEQLRSLRAELERGPRAAEVSTVNEEEAAVNPQYAGGFQIEHDWW
jgi:acylphosphatase